MTIQEYKNKVRELEDKHSAEIRALRSDFALKNAIYAIGDIATDHIGSIKVTGIACANYGEPQTAYYGIELKKDLSPRKDGARRWVYQSNINVK